MKLQKYVKSDKGIKIIEKKFPIYCDTKDLKFPRNIGNITVPMQIDDDCETDEETYEYYCNVTYNDLQEAL